MSLKLGRLLLKSKSLVKAAAPAPARISILRLQSSQAGQLGSVVNNVDEGQPVKAWLDRDKKRMVMQTLESSEQHEYPWVWLRDNCQCSECYESISQVRFVYMTKS